MQERRIAVIGSASGSGKTTLARELARRLDVPFVELDSLVHGPNWTETPNHELRTQLTPILAGDGWVVDGVYRGKLGTLVLDAADLVVWIDLPIRVWLPRLLRRTQRRVRANEELWTGNRETWRNTLIGREALVPYSFYIFFHRRRDYPSELAAFPVVRLRSTGEVDAFLDRYREPE
ncbi:MAG TPA: shikimate kinase [Gaiellaceae bacterium]|nr:shikimate kinase [Gaiellaceae bacterium]